MPFLIIIILFLTIIYNKLSFYVQNEDVINKANRWHWMKKILSSISHRTSLDQIYSLYIRPYFDFCDVIYHVPQENNSPDLHSLQHHLVKLRSIK